MFGMPTTTPSNDQILEVLGLSVTSTDQLCDRLRDLFQGSVEMDLEGRHETIATLGQQFSYSHLPAHLQPYSKPFHDVAARLIAEVPDRPWPSLALALQHLVEAKDWAVRAALPHATAIAESEQGHEERKQAIVDDVARFGRVTPENPMGVELPSDVDQPSDVLPGADLPRDAGLHG